VASILLSMGVLATMSRANTVLLLVALLALGAWVFAARDAALRSRYLRLIVGVVCCAVVTVVLMGPGEWLKELATLAELESPQTALVASCWEVGVDLASLQWLSGVGSGAFEAAAPSVMDGWRLGLVAYAHNGVLQVLAEMGLVVGGILLLGFFLGFLRLAYQTRKAVAIGATVVAVGVVAVQNFVDFSLWLPGVGVPAAALLGLAVATTWPPPTTRKRRFGTVRWPWAATIVVVGTLCVTSLHAWNERPAAWRGEILGHLADGKPGAIDVPSILAAHPHDFYAFRLAAVVARGQEEDTRALAYLKRAHALAPQESDTMAALAAAHLRLGEAESAEQLLTALAASDLGSERRALTVLLDAEKGPRNATDQAVLNRLLAKRPEWVLSAAAVLAEKGDNAAAESLLFWATNTFPESLEIYETLGSRWATRREKRSILDTLSTGLLARAGNLENLDERAPLERTAYLLQGHVMSLDGKPLEAWHLYTTAAELDPIHAAPPLIAAGLVAVTLRRDELLDQVLEGLTKHEIRGRWPSGRLNLLKSHQAEWRGDLDTAAQSMETALRHLKRHGPYLKRLEALYLRLDASAAAARIRGIIDGEVEAEEGTK
ncbi:MAG: tetratricopeptide (TPR) repeat protein, partial [Myxococcota bacterium]